MRFQLLAWCCAALTYAGASSPVVAQVPAPGGLDAGTTQRIDALIAVTMKHQNLPGLSIAIAREGNVLDARGYGYRNLTGKVPADSDTIYNIGSVSKQFTSASIMLLQQDGRLSVDDALSKYFPDYRFAKQITLRELLNHTSGIPDYEDLPTLPHYATALQFFQMIWGEPLDYEPGTRFEYSNTNYIVLGLVVEKVSGLTYREFLQRRLFTPLGLNETSARVEPRELPNGATGYTLDGGRIVYQPATVDDLGYGDGAVNSSVLDLVKWDAALDSGDAVNATSWSEMIAKAPGVLYEPTRGWYGFGLSVSQFYGRTLVEHGGDNPGFITENATVPADGLEIAMISNSDGFDSDLLFRRIFELVEHPTPAQIAEQEAPAPGEDPHVRALAAEWLTRLQTGNLDRSQLTPNAAAMLTRKFVGSMVTQASAFGTPHAFIYRGMDYRGRRFTYEYELRFDLSTVDYSIRTNEAGKIIDVSLSREDPALLPTANT